MKRFAHRSAALFGLVALLAVGCGKKGPTIQNNNGNENNETNNGTVGSNNGSGEKDVGEVCDDASECESGVCAGVCSAPTCSDTVQNGDEVAVDCGALGCPPCALGKTCNLDRNCVSGICSDGVCVESRCDDGEKNGLETDVDCGGLYCDQCPDTRACLDDSDCTSLVCEIGFCIPATCFDSTKNADETDADCGGPCDPCDDLLGCLVPEDCQSGVCGGDTCAEPTCEDGVQNGRETGPDCGGPDCDACGDGVGCLRDSDCVSQVCDLTSSMCATPACDDGEFNGDETDEDCGGSCEPCARSRSCLIGPDCTSKICNDQMQCTTPTCEDFVANGIETDVDCGGNCGGCADGRACSVGGDCLSLSCVNNVCAASQCSDGLLNGNETDLDCGGSCNKCLDGQDCSVDGDCLSGACGGSTCTPARCNDTRQNGTETDVDCGGSCTNACDDGLKCVVDADCQSSVCEAGICRAPTCSDLTVNGNETDVDCGGGAPCPQCPQGDACSQDTDCTTNICDGGTNGPICAICDERSKQVTARTCGYQNRGKWEQTCTNGGWIDTACVGVYYRSCLEILQAGQSTGDGMYELDPDGPASVYEPFDVVCDMTTDGGGWTEITKCVAKNDLNAVYTGIEAADQAGNSSECRYRTQDKGDLGHTHHMTFDFPGGWSEFKLNGYQIRANAGDMNTSDLGHVQRDWNVAYSNNQGDVSFGNPTAVGPRDSYSRHSVQSCFDCVIDWPNGLATIQLGTTANKFRIGWGEGGPENEGWYPWWEGTILLR